jgi:hypothetical protein
VLVSLEKILDKDETWEKFSTPEVAAFVLCTCSAMKQNSLTYIWTFAQNNF